jgi:hypothetical protein
MQLPIRSYSMERAFTKRYAQTLKRSRGFSKTWHLFVQILRYVSQHSQTRNPSNCYLTDNSVELCMKFDSGTSFDLQQSTHPASLTRELGCKARLHQVLNPPTTTLDRFFRPQTFVCLDYSNPNFYEATVLGTLLTTAVRSLAPRAPRTGVGLAVSRRREKLCSRSAHSAKAVRSKKNG